MPESLRTTSAAPPLVAPATIRSASPFERTYPEIAGFGPIYVMSIAPANKASIAEGPALKLFHSILTWGPIAFSNQPLFLPTIACGCVILGNAPTRITVWATANAPSNKIKQAETKKLRLVMTLALHQQRQHTRLVFFLFARLPAARVRTRASRLAADQIGQRRVLQNLGSRIPYFQKHS